MALVQNRVFFQAGILANKCIINRHPLAEQLPSPGERHYLRYKGHIVHAAMLFRDETSNIFTKTGHTPDHLFPETNDYITVAP